MAPTNFTRTGVFLYHTADGKEFRELRHPDDVFKTDSVATLDDAPVTVLHPTKQRGDGSFESIEVTPANWSELARGRVASPHRDDIYLAGDIRVMDAATIKALEAKELVEVSCGYTCKLDSTPGVYEGQSYDARQYDIAYNHLALGPLNWGRAGSAVRVHMDSADAISLPCSVTTQNQTPTNSPTDKPATSESPAPVQQTSDAAVQALTGQLAATNSTIAELTARLAAATDPARTDAAVDQRVRLVADARSVLGDTFVHAGKSNTAIMTEVVKAITPQVVTDAQSPAFIEGAYQGALASRVAQAHASVAVLGAALVADAANKGTAPGTGTGNVIGDAADRMAKRNADQWRQPTGTVQGQTPAAR